MREVKELMELYTQKMEEIEDVKNDEEVFHQIYHHQYHSFRL